VIFLKCFFDITVKVLGTSNTFFHEFIDLDVLNDLLYNEHEYGMREVALRMRAKLINIGRMLKR